MRIRLRFYTIATETYNTKTHSEP
ncbi:hypothetical protein AYX14_07174 [Cryptococcus neoformans]|nr:hypothetical protein AYX14_07174 [Cryptococcus neoformans var. grubii]